MMDREYVLGGKWKTVFPVEGLSEGEKEDRQSRTHTHPPWLSERPLHKERGLEIQPPCSSPEAPKSFHSGGVLRLEMEGPMVSGLRAPVPELRRTWGPGAGHSEAELLEAGGCSRFRRDQASAAWVAGGGRKERRKERSKEGRK